MTTMPDVLPGDLQVRRQVGAGRDEQAQLAAQLGVELAEDEPAQRGRGGAGRCDGRRSNRRRLAALLDLAGQGAPEELQDLRRQDHRGDAELTQRLEDDARVARAHVERPRRRSRCRRRASEPARRGATAAGWRPRAGGVPREVGEQPDRLEEVAVGQEHALGVGRGAGGEDDLEERVAVGRGQAASCASQSSGKSSLRVGGQVFQLEDLEVVEPDLERVGRVVAARRRPASGCRLRAEMRSMTPGVMRRSSGHDDDTGAHRAPVDRRQSRRGW